MKRVIKNDGEVTKGFVSEDGAHYRTYSQDMEPIIDRVKYLNEKVNGADRSTNRAGMKYLGSIPRVMLEDWLTKHNYTMHDFAINAGGEKGKTDPNGGGVKDKFIKYFMSREFSKLHTQHTTSSVEGNMSGGGIYLGPK